MRRSEVPTLSDIDLYETSKSRATITDIFNCSKIYNGTNLLHLQPLPTATRNTGTIADSYTRKNFTDWFLVLVSSKWYSCESNIIMVMELFLKRERDIPSAQFHSVSREETYSIVASFSRNSTVSGITEHLPFLFA